MAKELTDIFVGGSSIRCDSLANYEPGLARNHVPTDCESAQVQTLECLQ
jgi:hypothetical protein